LNAGVVPYCFIYGVSDILVYNCGKKPDIDSSGETFITTPHDIINLLSNIQDKLTRYSSRKFDSGLFWDSEAGKDFKYDQSAYEQLLVQLKNVKANIISRVGQDKSNLVKRILMMLILIKYLEERKDEYDKGALNPKEFYKSFNAEDPTLTGVLKDSETFIAVLAKLASEEHFNGQIFFLNDEEITNLKNVDLVIFQHFVNGDTSFFSSGKHGIGQMSLWRLYQFNYLPIELISHIYEDFLADENGQKKKGVVYTPPYLVQFLIDKCMPLNAPREAFKILDPACGSGIFLVGAYKRMIQWWRLNNNWEKPQKENINALKQILVNNIYGCDLEEEAVTLSYFSLGLALLDALSPKEIWNNVHFDNLVGKNLIPGDFFKTLHQSDLTCDFDLVIGNPPFESSFTNWANIIDKVEKKNNKQRPEVPDNQIALLFLEQSFKLLKNGGHCCLILPSGPVLYNNKTHNFRNYLFSRNFYKEIFDFTALRAKLFIGSSSKAKPAVAVVYSEKKPPEGKPIHHYIFRRTKASGEKIEFEIDHYDIHTVSHKNAEKYSGIWQANFMGGGRLHRLLQKIDPEATLEKYLSNMVSDRGWKVAEGWIASATYKPIARAEYLNLKEYRSKAEEEEFASLKEKYSASWITGHQLVETDDFTEQGIKETKLCNLLYFYRSAKTNREIFEPPHLLIKEQSGTKSIPVEFREDYLTFRNEIIGIHCPPSDKQLLKDIEMQLKGNSSYSALLWLLSGRIITSREGVVLKSDILSLPYSVDGLKLDEIETILLEDISEHYSEFRKEGEKSEVLNEVNDDQLKDFGIIYCQVLNSIYKKFRPLSFLKGLEFIAYSFVLGEQPEYELESSIDKIEDQIRNLIDSKQSHNLWIKRIIKVYHKNVIILYKPNQKRYWLKSIAIRDADETFMDLYKQGK
jgi:hypothetical protein